MTCKEDSVLYALDRDTFNAIVKEASVKRRERFETFIQRIEILQELNSYERNALCDVLVSETFEPGETVIKQGDEGQKFYFVEEGSAEAFQLNSGRLALTAGMKEPQLVFKYRANDYFGELALLKNEPRAATVKASNEGKLKVCSLDREAFKRLLGPLESMLKKNFSKYQAYLR